MNDTYFIQYSAGIENDHLRVVFQRLYRDGRDIMCDSLKPQWEPLDDFIIQLEKRNTTRTIEYSRMSCGTKVRIESGEVKTLETMEIRTHSKQVANHIWYLAKHGASFDTIKAMHEAKKF